MAVRQDAVKSKRGWLKKFMHGAFSSSWKPKYVVLGEGQLSWYTSDKEGSKAERSFSVQLIKFAAAMESLGELPFVFEIVVGADKSYYFQVRLLLLLLSSVTPPCAGPR